MESCWLLFGVSVLRGNEIRELTELVTSIPWSRTPMVLDRWKTRITGSNPAEDKNLGHCFSALCCSLLVSCDGPIPHSRSLVSKRCIVQLPEILYDCRCLTH
jgi:hypothetical protein